MGDRNWDELIREVDGMIPLDDIVKATGDWRRSKGFETGWSNFAEKLMLVVTEIGEAIEATEAARLCSRKMQHGSTGESMIDLALKLSAAVDNYVEEWIDVMVRIFDLVEACQLPVLRSGDLSALHDARSPCLGTSRTLDDTIVSGFDLNLRRVILVLSEAMEQFRDLDLSDSSIFSVPVDATENQIDDLSHSVLKAARIAAWAITDVGEHWPKHYAAKMKVNEERPTKHGRQR